MARCYGPPVAAHVGVVSPCLDDSSALPRMCCTGTEWSCRWDTRGDGHRRIMAKHGDPSDHCCHDFQCACTRGGGGHMIHEWAKVASPIGV